MSKELEIGTKIKLNKSGDEYEITVIRGNGVYDLKSLKLPFAWMPDVINEFYAIKLQDYTIINKNQNKGS